MITRRNFMAGILSAAVTTATTAPFALAGLGRGYDLDGEELPEIGTPVLNRPEPTYIEGRLRLKNAHTGERGEFFFRDEYGLYNADMLQALNWMFRCHNDGDLYLPIDIKCIEMLNYSAKWLGDPEILIHSAYRTPRYNQKLSINNENVARRSLHLWGKAIDFSVPGIPIAQVCSIAQGTRQVFGGAGGIGYYPRNGGFVHVDSGERGATWVK